MPNSLSVDLKKVVAHFKLQGPWVFLGRVYLMLASLLLSVIFARMLTVEEYGTYKYILSVFSMMAVFSLTESSQLVIRYVPRGFDTIIKTLLPLRLKYSLIGSVALALIGVHCLLNSEVGLGLAFSGLALLYPVYFAFQLFDPYMQSKLQFKRLNTVYIVRTSVQILSVVLIYFVTDNIFIAVFCMLLFVALVNLLAFANTTKAVMSAEDREERYEKKMVGREAILLSLTGVLPVIVEQLDKVLIARIVSYEALALFSIGVVFGRAINGFFKPFISTLNAKLVHRSMDAWHLSLLFIVGTLIGMALSALAPGAIFLLYGDSYAVSVHYAQVILLSLGLYLVHTMLYNQSMYNKQSSLRKIYVNNVVIPAFAIVYLLWAATSGMEQHGVLMLMALVYPLKLIFSLSALLLMDRVGWFREARASV